MFDGRIAMFDGRIAMFDGRIAMFDGRIAMRPYGHEPMADFEGGDRQAPRGFAHNVNSAGLAAHRHGVQSH
jgi:hypothetical protein